jgi:hypothetical protein
VLPFRSFLQRRPTASGAEPFPISPVIADAFTAHNYGAATLTGQWSSTQYFNSMEGTNSVLVFAHGNSNVHTSGNYREDIRPFGYDQDSGGVGWVHGYDEMRSLHMGTGLPPFNSSYNGTLMPPTNLFWLYSCHLGQEPEFHRILFPYWNAFSILSGNVCENQSYVGFTTFVRLTLEPTVRALQCLLNEGRTIYATR